jgi:hypothetical protein
LTGFAVSLERCYLGGGSQNHFQLTEKPIIFLGIFIYKTQFSVFLIHLLLGSTLIAQIDVSENDDFMAHGFDSMDEKSSQNHHRHF